MASATQEAEHDFWVKRGPDHKGEEDHRAQPDGGIQCTYKSQERDHCAWR